MFVTMPHFEQFMPPSLAAPDHKYWRAVTLSLESPWYLFVYEAEYDGEMVPHTTLVAWESTLLEIVATIPPADRRGIARVEKERNPGTRWMVNWIETIWAAAAEEVEETGTVLLQLEGDSQLRSAHLEPVPARGGRELLFSAAPKRERVAVTPTPVVPADFPNPGAEAVVAGAQPKVVVRNQGGVYKDDAEVRRAERYDICEDLYDQVIAYAEHKRTEKPNLPLEKLVSQVLVSIEQKRFGWGLSPAEALWLSSKVRAHFDSPDKPAKSTT